MDTLTPASAPSSDTAQDPAWLREALAPHMPGFRGPVSVRRHEPESPESIFLREQAAIRAGVTLKDSKAMAERLKEAAAAGLEDE